MSDNTEPVLTQNPEQTQADVTDINEELKELYTAVSAKIRLAVGNQKLTVESFQTILMKIVDTIEQYPKYQSLPGTEKRAIAMNLIHLIIDDLHNNGQIDDPTYGWMNMGVTFLGPILFDGAKLAWKKIQGIIGDIEQHGTSGCCGRNFSLSSASKPKRK